MMIFVLALLPLGDAFALGVSPYTRIKEISIGTGDKPIFRLLDAGEAGTGCVNGIWIRFPDQASYEGNRRLYDMMVDAAMNGLLIQVKTVSCDGDYPLLDRVWVRTTIGRDAEGLD